MKRPITQRPEAGHWNRIIRPKAMLITPSIACQPQPGIAQARRADDVEEAADDEEQRHHEGQDFRRDHRTGDEDQTERAVEDRGERV